MNWYPLLDDMFDLIVSILRVNFWRMFTYSSRDSPIIHFFSKAETERENINENLYESISLLSKSVLSPRLS